MTEQEWLTLTDPAAMLAEVTPAVAGRPVRTTEVATPRKLRLFAVTCCRAVWDGVPCGRCDGRGKVTFPEEAIFTGGNPYVVDCPVCGGTGRVGGLTDPRSRRAVEVAERFADGEADDWELRVADEEADRACVDNGGFYAQPFWAAECCTLNGLAAAREVSESGIVLPAAQADLLRCIFGNPWRPATSPYLAVRGAHSGAPFQIPDVEWLTTAVQELARAIYDDREWEALPVLADALEEAGATDAELLAHLRGPGPHARGCWVLDLLLGRE